MSGTDDLPRIGTFMMPTEAKNIMATKSCMPFNLRNKQYKMHEYRQFPIVVLLAMLHTLTAHGQIHLSANDKSIRYDLIQPEHTIYKVTMFDTAGNITRELAIDHLTKIDSSRREIDFINSVQYAPGKLLIDSSIDNISGSVRYILTTIPSAKNEFIRFLPDSVETLNTVKGVSTTRITPMGRGYFDDNSIWDILGYIPFQKGILYQLDCYGTDIHTQVSIPYTIEYVFDEYDRESTGNVVSSMVLKVSSAGSTDYIWINRKTHSMVKDVGEGKGYRYMKVAV